MDFFGRTGVKGNLSGIAGDKVGSRNGQGGEIIGPAARHFVLASQVKEQSNQVIPVTNPRIPGRLGVM